jgi:hypothetical protein
LMLMNPILLWMFWMVNIHNIGKRPWILSFNLQSNNISPYQILLWNLFSLLLSNVCKVVLLDLWLLKVFFPHQICKQTFNIFSINFHPFFFIQFEFNSIESNCWIELNSIEFKAHPMLFNIFIRMKLNFHKINSFFSSIHQLIIIGSAQQHRAQVKQKVLYAFSYKFKLWKAKLFQNCYLNCYVFKNQTRTGSRAPFLCGTRTILMFIERTATRGSS